MMQTYIRILLQNKKVIIENKCDLNIQSVCTTVTHVGLRKQTVITFVVYQYYRIITAFIDSIYIIMYVYKHMKKIPVIYKF